MTKILAIVAIGVVLTVEAQFSPATSHYMLTSTIRQPGFWGAQSTINVLANTRYQYAGIDGAPVQANIAFSSPIPYAKGQGFGGELMYDQLGAYRFLMFNAGYNYTFVKDKFTVGAGISLGIKYTRFDGAKITTPTGDYSTSINHNDPLLSQNMESSVVPAISVGFGFSNDLITQQIVYSDIFADNITTLEDKSSINYGKSLLSLTKFNIEIGSNFDLEPSMQIHTNFKQFQHILGVTAMYKNRVGIGLYSRGYTRNTFESLIPIVRAKAFKYMTFQYSYDVLINGIQKGSSGSHELSVIYAMPKTWHKYYGKAINNPRYL